MSHLETEEVTQLLEASLRELGEISVNVPPRMTEVNVVIGGTAHLMREIEDQRQQIEASLARLGADIRAGFRRLGSAEKARFIKGLIAGGTTQQRIATLLGITQSAVSQHLTKARKNSTRHFELIARIDGLMTAGVSADAIASMLRERHVPIDAADVKSFVEVYRKIINAEE